jgi:hypothetical protein
MKAGILSEKGGAVGQAMAERHGNWPDVPWSVRLV